MVRRSRARYLAPIALAAVIAGAYVIVHAGLTDKHATAQSQKARRKGRHGRYAHTRFYVVQAGDTLTRISSKTNIAVTRIEELNPNIDPNSLQTGQRLRLRR
jgi:LysM repeat protein